MCVGLVRQDWTSLKLNIGIRWDGLDEMRCGEIERDILIDRLGNLELRSSSRLSSSRKGKKRRPIEKEGKGRKGEERKGKGKKGEQWKGRERKVEESERKEKRGKGKERMRR